MRRFSSSSPCLFALVTIATLLALPAAAEVQISAELSAATTAVKSDSAVFVELTLRNDSDETVALLKWNTPFYGFNKDLFEITLDGEPVRYLGRLVHYADPVADSYLVLAPGEKKVGLVELSAVYGFTQDGNYEIQYQSYFQDALGALDRDDAGNSLSSKQAPASETLLVRSPSLSLFVEKRQAPQPSLLYKATSRDEPEVDEELSLATRYVSPSFTGCSSSRRNIIRTALGNAESIADNSTCHLNLNPLGSTTYDDWFGTWTSGRFSTVRSNFFSIRSVLKYTKIKFDCDCNMPGVYAFVFANQPYDITLCNVFWTVPATGAGSRADTLIHEISHFDVVAGTDDLIYGTTGSRNLANTNPNNAIRNADNYAFFSVNAACSAASTPPVSSFTWSHYAGPRVEFNGTGSYDPDGSITNYRWTFGDGNVTNGNYPTAVNYYFPAGYYWASLRVTDNTGLTHTSTKQIYVPPF